MSTKREHTCRINAVNKRRIKEEAQDNIMHYIDSVFLQYGDTDVNPDSALYKETCNQIRRIKKLFGYD